MVSILLLLIVAPVGLVQAGFSSKFINEFSAAADPWSEGILCTSRTMLKKDVDWIRLFASLLFLNGILKLSEKYDISKNGHSIVSRAERLTIQSALWLKSYLTRVELTI